MLSGSVETEPLCSSASSVSASLDPTTGTSRWRVTNTVARSPGWMLAAEASAPKTDSIALDQATSSTAVAAASIAPDTAASLTSPVIPPTVVGACCSHPG